MREIPVHNLPEGASPLLSETVIPLAQAADQFPQAITARQVRRFVHPNRDGHALESIRLGGKIYTSTQAVERYILACSKTPTNAV